MVNTHTHTLVTTRLNPACHVAHCCAPQYQCVPRPHETTRARHCQACCMLHIACLVAAHFLSPCTDRHLLGPRVDTFYVLALHILLISRSMTWNHDYGACMIMAYNNLCAVALISPTQTNRGEDRNRRKHKQTDMTISYCCCLALAMNIKRHDDDEHASILKNTMHIFLQNLCRKKTQMQNYHRTLQFLTTEISASTFRLSS